MIPDFTFPGITTRVVFGSGTLAGMGDELRRIGRSRALILSSPRQRQERDLVAQSLGTLMAGVYEGAAPIPPWRSRRRRLRFFAISQPTR
jgi:maleylacetate reductase